MVFARLKRKLKNWLNENGMILMYHQVCHKPVDPWQLAVTPSFFEEQVNYLASNYEVVPLDELVTRIRRNKPVRRAVSITFDDGFRDNYTNARPVLEAYKIPATFYISTQTIPSGIYWWDELEQLILHTASLPSTLELTAMYPSPFTYIFSKHAVLDENLSRQIRDWKAGTEPPNERVELFLTLWNLMRPLPFAMQQLIIQDLRAWAGVYTVDRSGAEVMTFDELLLLAANPLFSIGAHTVHHAYLSAHDPEDQAFEILESKRTLESWLGRRVTGFAYPYGNSDAATRKILRLSGFDHAVSTEGRPLAETEDVFELPRIQVKNEHAKIFARDLHQLLAI